MVKSESKDDIEAKQIEKALERNWSIRGSDISVSISGTKVTLTGNVASGYQKVKLRRLHGKHRACGRLRIT